MEVMEVREVMDEVEAADYLRHEASTLEGWRGRGKGPIYSQSGQRGKITYLKADLDAWLRTHRRDPATGEFISKEEEAT